MVESFLHRANNNYSAKSKPWTGAEGDKKSEIGNANNLVVVLGDLRYWESLMGNLERNLN